jgi:hypothetical protein
VDDVEQAREAFGRRDWTAAHAAYRAAGPLDPDDLDALAECAHWLGRPDEAIECHTTAFRLHAERGDPLGGARSALMLAVYLRLQGSAAPADGWLVRPRPRRLMGRSTHAGRGRRCTPRPMRGAGVASYLASVARRTGPDEEMEQCRST